MANIESNLRDSKDSITLASLDSKNIESSHVDSIKLASADTKSNDRILSLNGKIDSTITLANNIESNSQTHTHRPIYNTESNKILTLADNETSQNIESSTQTPQSPSQDSNTGQNISQDSNNTQSNAQNSTQTTDAKKSYKLESVVVSASGNEQEYTLAPASISVVSPKEIQTRPFRDLAEALQNVPGVSIDDNVTKTGGYGISIRGMGSSYTLILIDGKRVNADSSLFPNGFGDSQTSFMPPLSAIERIEVIRGPASTLYGSDAIGGVVNIITKKNFSKWGVSASYDYTFQEKRPFGNTQRFQFFSAGPLNSAKNMGLMLRGSVYTRDGVTTADLAVSPTNTGALGSNGTIQNSSLTAGAIVGSAPGRVYNVGGRFLWNSQSYTGSKPTHSAYLDLDYSQQNYDNSLGLVMSNRNANSFNITWSDEMFKRRSGYEKKYNIYRGNVVLSHTGHYIDNVDSILAKLSSDTSLIYNVMNNDGRTVAYTAVTGAGGTADTTNYISSVNGVTSGDSRELFSNDIILDSKANAFLNIAKWFNINATLGGRYWFNSFNDKLLQLSTNSSFKYQHIGALYGEAEFGFLDRIFLTAGIRGNFNSLFGANISPRFYISYNAIDSWLTIKGGISTGYKSPALNNLIPEIVSLSGSGQAPTYGNPNLVPESSINYELSFLSDNEWFSASITGFFIQFNNKITQVGGLAGGITNGSVVPIPGSPTCNAGPNYGCSYYDNAGKAISYGIEIFASMKPLSLWLGYLSANAAYTWNYTEITQDNTASDVGTPFNDVPLHSFNTSINYDFKNYGFYLREEIKAGIWRGNPSVANSAAAALGEYYKPYFLTHLGGYYSFNEKFRLNAAIYNLFDFNFIQYTAYGTNNASYENAFNYVREGRRYYIGITMDF
ncbi:TonB-dependent receptor domain-containing protein [Helicobacter saguini]|uniref:TonB-dependent receptor n=1 Tax=Helicobacter saguini TaxID=1548018 RepID=A0A6L7DH71_9HELI|nr:TonB-dependent receptor [Helicobacter saguini]MWV69676.1 TonB-dependent receptor [Helicobacter saguini]